jgi:translation elongation factor EF-G
MHFPEGLENTPFNILFYNDLTTSFSSTATILITAEAPLSELRGYSTHLRIISSGKAIFGMEFSHYELMDQSDQNKAIKNITGFDPIT